MSDETAAVGKGTAAGAPAAARKVDRVHPQAANRDIDREQDHRQQQEPGPEAQRVLAGELQPRMIESLRRIVASQEVTVEAAISGDRDAAVNAMLLDPLAGRIDFDHVVQMTDEMLAATSRWLPQFS